MSNTLTYSTQQWRQWTSSNPKWSQVVLAELSQPGHRGELIFENIQKMMDCLKNKQIRQQLMEWRKPFLRARADVKAEIEDLFVDYVAAKLRWIQFRLVAAEGVHAPNVLALKEMIFSWGVIPHEMYPINNDLWLHEEKNFRQHFPTYCQFAWKHFSDQMMPDDFFDHAMDTCCKTSYFRWSRAEMVLLGMNNAHQQQSLLAVLAHVRPDDFKRLTDRQSELSLDDRYKTHLAQTMTMLRSLDVKTDAMTLFQQLQAKPSIDHKVSTLILPEGMVDFNPSV